MQKPKLLGYTFFASFDINSDHFVKSGAWVLAKDGSKLNVLSMHFPSNSIKTIGLSLPKPKPKLYPGASVAISN